MTLGELLDGSCMKASHQNDKAMTRSLEILSQFPHSLGEGLKMELMVDHVYAMKPPKSPGFRELVLGRWHTQRGQGSSTPLPMYLALCISSIWMCVCIIYYIHL